jgi:hypothetical protein
VPARHSPRHRPAGRRRARLGWAGAALALVAASTGAVLLTRPAASPTVPPDRLGAAESGSAESGAAESGTAAPVTPDPASVELVAWAARDLPADARLLAAPGIRADLEQAGAPPDLLESTDPTGPDDVVLEVSTGAAPAGARVLARFGDLVVLDPSPGAPTPAQLDRRRTLAEALVANPGVEVGTDAAAVLSAADVDTRLLLLLAALAAQQGVGVAAFPGLSGTDGLPARRVLLDSVGGARVGTGEPATDALVTWLDAQLPPYAPDDVTVTGDGVVVGHRYVSDPDDAVSDPGQ